MPSSRLIISVIAGEPTTPLAWVITSATVMSRLPAAANSGQYEATGASTSSFPRSHSICMQSAVTALVTDMYSGVDSAVHGAEPAEPVHRSTTFRPSCQAAYA